MVLMAATGLLGGLHALGRLTEADTLYTRLIGQEAEAVKLISRAGVLVMNDERLLLRVILADDVRARSALLAEAQEARALAAQTLDEAAAAIPRLSGRVEGFSQRFRHLTDLGERIDNAAVAGEVAEAKLLLAAERSPLFGALRREMRELVAEIDAEMDAASAKATQRVAETRRRTLGILLLGTAASLLLACHLTGRAVVRPLGRLAERMRALQAGDTASGVPGTDRRDVIGRMARSLESFRNSALERDRLGAEANTDPLTGLPNRRAVAAALAATMGEGIPVAVVAVDLDHFKAANDAHGHAAGDAILRAVAARLRGAVRSSEDLVGRLGGDEFVLFLRGITDGAEAARLAERLRAALHEPVAHLGAKLPLGATLGVAFAPRDAATAEGAMVAADEALVLAKRHGRGGIGFAGWELAMAS